MTFKRKTRSYLGQGHSYTKFKQFGSFVFELCSGKTSKNALIDHVSLTFDLSPQNHVTSRISQRHSLYQVWTLWDHSFYSYAADRQTNRRTWTSSTRRLTEKILHTTVHNGAPGITTTGIKCIIPYHFSTTYLYIQQQMKKQTSAFGKSCWRRLSMVELMWLQRLDRITEMSKWWHKTSLCWQHRLQHNTFKHHTQTSASGL